MLASCRPLMHLVTAFASHFSFLLLSLVRIESTALRVRSTQQP